MSIALIGLLLIVALSLLPQMWIRGVLTRHQAERADLPGTGAEFARHALDRLGLTHVGVERTDLGDHYDPESKTVRLSEPHYAGRSLAAVVVAAHEIGHAMQDEEGYGPLRTRTKLAKQAMGIERFGVIVMMLGPVLMILSKSPAVMALDFLAGAVILLMSVVIHIVTLPVEIDASFRRALPLLKAGGFIPDKDMPAARSLLRAAAYTYVAAAAMSLLNVGRWLRVLRF
jgi:hypothetical protein